MVVDLVVPLANNVKTDLISLKYTLYLPSGVQLFTSQSEHTHLMGVVYNFLSVNQSTPIF